MSSHSYNIWIVLFLDQILLLLVVVLSLKNFHPPFAEGIVVVVDTDFVDNVAEDTVVVEIVMMDIEQDDTEVALIQLAYAHHFWSSRYPSSFPAVMEVLYIIFHHDLLIYKIYNTH